MILALSVENGIIVNVAAQEEIKLGGRKIVGGERTSIQDHPWQVAITIIRADGTYLCGGSIIAEKWVVSAAHCFRTSDNPNIVKVKAGATNYVDEGLWSQIEKVVIHENYEFWDA